MKKSAALPAALACLKLPEAWGLWERSEAMAQWQKACPGL